MEHVEFGQGIWSTSWDGIQNELDRHSRDIGSEPVVRGSARYGKDGAMLELFGGRLLSVFASTKNRLPHTAPWLYGRSDDGCWIALQDCHFAGDRSKGLPSVESRDLYCRQSITGEVLLSSRNSQFDPQREVKGMRLRIRNLTDWYQNMPYVMPITVGEDDVLLRIDRSKIEDRILLDTDDFRVVLQGNYSRDMPEYHAVTFRYDCDLKIDYKSGKTLEQVHDMAEKLSWFLSFCTGFVMPVESIELYYDDEPRSVAYYANFMDSDVPSPQQLQSMPFPYPVIKDCIQSCLGMWLNANIQKDSESVESSSSQCAKRHYFDQAKDEIASLIAYKWRMPVTMHTAAAAQAFEALSRFDNETLESRSEEQTSEIIKHLGCCLKTLSSDDSNWIRQRIGGKHEKGARRLSMELMNNHHELANWLVPDSKHFINTIIGGRNKSHHGTGDTEIDVSSMGRIADGLVFVCYALLWEMMGITSQMIIQQVEQSGFRKNTVEWLQAEFAKKEPSSNPIPTIRQ